MAGKVKPEAEFGEKLWTQAESGEYCRGVASNIPGPPRRITPNQLVAFNMRRWRKAAGLTQADLGEALDREPREISARERSWDEGARPREFNADDLLALAAALDVPLAAFFLPPDDEGDGAHYLLEMPSPALQGRGMGSVFGYLWPDAGQADTPVMNAYRETLTAAVRAYLDPARGEEIVRYLDEMTEREQADEMLGRLAEQRAALRSVLSDLDSLASAVRERRPAE
jgi:transcriptional regulator with XRE-family HTH domain